MVLSCKRVELIQYVAVCILAVVSGQFITGPNNTVAFMGTTATLYCSTSTNATLGFNWNYKGIGICSPLGCSAPYSVSSSSRSSNLTMPCSLNVAGEYQCNPTGLGAQSAQLIILESNPACTSNATNNVVLGQSASMSCTINYAATPNTYSPGMIWTGQAPIVPINSSSTTMVTSTLNVGTSSANIPYVLPYTCTTLMVNVVPPGQNFSTNIPTFSNGSSYSSSYTYPELLVLYPANTNNISITGTNLNSTSDGQVGEAPIYSTLICSAVAYQGAVFTYKWTSPTDTTVNVAGPSITLSILGNIMYMCTATNAAGSGSNYINVTVTGSTTPAPDTTPISLSCSCCTGCIIGIVVGVTVGLTVLSTLLLCFFWRRCPLYSKVPCHKEDMYQGNNARNGSGRSSQTDIVRTQQENNSPNDNYQMNPDVINPAYRNDEVRPELLYAELQVDNTPRSRNPVQSPAGFNEELTLYAPVGRA